MRTSRRSIIIVFVFALFWLCLPAESDAQCSYQVSVYGDHWKPDPMTLQMYGAGLDYSYCPGAQHAYEIRISGSCTASGTQQYTYTNTEGVVAFHAGTTQTCTQYVAFRVRCSIPDDWLEEVGWFDEFPVEGAEPQGTVSITSVTGIEESGKSTHYISPTGGGYVVIEATIDPPGTDPSYLQWFGGEPGDNNLQRRVSRAQVANVEVTVAFGNTSSVMIHVAEGSPPPPQANDAGKNPVFGGYQAPVNGRFGEAFFDIGAYGIVDPTYAIYPFLEGNGWVFRLDDVSHVYRWGIRTGTFFYQGHSMTDLLQGNPPSFPVPSGMNLVQAHNQARSDFDISVPTAATDGPPRIYYWNSVISSNHEQAHVTDFYTNFWTSYMMVFERDDVEASAVKVAFDCNNPPTMTGSSAQAMFDWQSKVSTRHGQAYTVYLATAPGPEGRAHSVSNPQYVPIRNAIPNP